MPTTPYWRSPTVTLCHCPTNNGTIDPVFYIPLPCHPTASLAYCKLLHCLYCLTACPRIPLLKPLPDSPTVTLPPRCLTSAFPTVLLYRLHMIATHRCPSTCCNVILLRYSSTVSLSHYMYPGVYCPIVPPPNWPTAPKLNFPIALLSHCPLPHCPISSPPYCQTDSFFTPPPPHSHIDSFPHPLTVTLKQ